MKIYKVFRWLLKASALTTVMFIMQACYGSPNMPPEMPDEMELTSEEDSIQETEVPEESPKLDSTQKDSMNELMF